jgi:hypothetical protein
MMGGLLGLCAVGESMARVAFAAVPGEPLRPAPLAGEGEPLIAVRFDSRRRKPDGLCATLPAGRLISVNVGPNRAARRVRNRSRCKRGVRKD